MSSVHRGLPGKPGERTELPETGSPSETELKYAKAKANGRRGLNFPLLDPPVLPPDVNLSGEVEVLPPQRRHVLPEISSTVSGVSGA
jgi:hypothetical protein